MDVNEAIRLAVGHYRSGNLQKAEYFCKTVLEQQPNNAEALSLLGIIYIQLRNYDLAARYLRKSLRFNADNPDTYLALGIAMQQEGLTDVAIGHYEKAIALDPNSSEAYKNLGNVFAEKGNLGEAIACFNKAAQLNPHDIHACHSLAAALVMGWRLSDAIKTCYRILELNPSDIFAYYTLGNIFMTQGKLKQAEQCFRHALHIDPGEMKSHQALLMLTSYYPGYGAQAIFSEHLRFAKQFEEPLRYAISAHINERTYNRRLKIGYVSPDFKSHPVAFFIEPALCSHNRDFFEIYCYSDVAAPDEITVRLQKLSSQWRNIVGVSDEKVAELIRGDGIDILIDLAGHTGGVNRMLLFARKPAPVQVNWIGYPGTTGLSAMDYKIVDSFTDPPGMTDQFYSEKLIRLPNCFLCYLPHEDSPEVHELPALKKGYITFGSFNNFTKVAPEDITLWSKILKEIPDARLVMKSPSFLDKTTRSYAQSLFISEGIEAERVQSVEPVPSIRSHLELYNQIDIGLDTFPYNGTTTTCEALWMGVPVVALAGDTPASRVGVSLLSNAGLKEFVAKTHEEYFEIAVNLANDQKKLQVMREKLRGMMICSPLTDAKRFTEDLERCYSEIWQIWCRFADSR